MSTKKIKEGVIKELKRKIHELDLKMTDLDTYKKSLEAQLPLIQTQKKVKKNSSINDPSQPSIANIFKSSQRRVNEEESKVSVERVGNSELRNSDMIEEEVRQISGQRAENPQLQGSRDSEQLRDEYGQIRPSDNVSEQARGQARVENIEQEIEYRKEDLEEEKKECELDIEEAIAREIQRLVKKSTKVKATYSANLKKEVQEKLACMSMQAVFLTYQTKIPRTTLYNWKSELKGKKGRKKVNQGRKTPFVMLEEELFDWFLVLRARKISVTNGTLQKKARKIKAKILEDDGINASTKNLYKGFTASDGWTQNFKKRYSLSRRAVTTRCEKTIEEMKVALTNYFQDLDLRIEDTKPSYIFNMDEVAIFFEMDHDYTIEIKGKKCVGQLSSGKSKERVTLVITACSDGRLLPPFFIFKTSKPKDKTFKDEPPVATPTLPYETNQLLKEAKARAIHNYSGWMNKKAMIKHFLPFYQRLSSIHNSMLIFDNCSAHVADDSITYLEDKKINYLPLTPHTTAICQPIDLSIGRSIKAKIRQQFNSWLTDNLDFMVKYDEAKDKYKFEAPDKSLIIKWTLQAYEEIQPTLIKKSFELAGITNKDQRKVIIDNKARDLFVAYDVDEYVNIEKAKICELKLKNNI